MSLIDAKNTINNEISDLLTKAFIKEDISTAQALSDIQKDIANDFYTIVVLGEFKRGKSTFINALLQKELLPSDVLPETATINALMYGEQGKVSVVYNDGTERAGIADRDYLKKFSATTNEADVSNIKYIKVTDDAEILRNKLVIVDTPGVSDINEQRCEVTYRFIPKANAVLFLLDANSPLKRTEKEFVEEKLLAQGIDNIVFIVNKYDNVDEEEDEDLLEELEEKLRKTFCEETEGNKLSEIKLYPLSAKYALKGYLENNSKLVKLSGIDAVKAAVADIVYNGKVEEEKINRYKMRLKTALCSLYSQLENTRALKAADVEQLQKMSRDLDSMIAQQEENKVNIAKYVEAEKGNIFSMVDKSISRFYRRMEEDVIDDINMYRGMDFKQYVEGRISKQLQRGLENWVATYSPHVEHLLKGMEKELANGISYQFRCKVQLNASGAMPIGQKSYNFNLQADDVSNATINAGAIAAGGAGLMMLIGGPVLMPFISMAAFPFLQRKFLEEKLADAKAQIIPAVENQLATYVGNLKNEIHRYVEERCIAIINNTEASYDNVLYTMKQDIDVQIAEKQSQSNELSVDVQKISQQLAELQKILSSL